MRTAVVILNYNSSGDCAKCIASLKNQRDVELEIIIVDNCSAPADREAVEKLCQIEGCTFIANTENRGYNAGNNVGLCYAAAKGYEYALIANPDMIFSDDHFLKKLCDKMDGDESVAVASGDLLHADGWHQNPMLPDCGVWKECLAALIFPFELLYFYLKRNRTPRFIADHTKSGYCAKLSGCSFLIRMSFLAKINFFDENVFLYCEEPILAKQVAANKMKMFYDAEAKAFHNHIASKKGGNFRRMLIFFKSRNYFLTTYGCFQGWKKLLLIFKYWQLFVWILLYGTMQLCKISKVLDNECS